MALATEQLLKKKGKGDVRVRKGTSGPAASGLRGTNILFDYISYLHSSKIGLANQNIHAD